MKLIIAVNKISVIGLNGGMAWRSSEDLKHFKRLTVGQKLLVGRTTFEGLPPLKDRELIVVGTGYHTLEEGLAKNPDWVIGGRMLYESVSHLCTEYHVSIINDFTEGDVHFPNLSDHITEDNYFEYEFDINR